VTSNAAGSCCRTWLGVVIEQIARVDGVVEVAGAGPRRYCAVSGLR